ncbi:hypothetical protein LEMA_P113970.1 [Plenodomus lingam JN3]|uniref:CENP-T/Histone H4 histone fold domain-containing protein n=1 Tax=Leptosphaeria maculans (strain JN3 / isolate v23.1.3 / race Av1-4-5-6-7-8) TaxID=985895 RepID=E4ZUA3_LEPMJ|nr:hypothetical protein LEMA_P113970.1 [Plenodomus lingam JN3]CBX94982.1 hypothetical protein LEMA_P113970.1 [Plenodomus lingam JN3]
MADSARKKQRLSPEHDLINTPSNDARTPITPFRRAISAGPTPGSRKTPTFRTPGTGKTPRGGPATRPLPFRRAAPTTPHAIKALRERANAARTPGNNRRRSGRMQRETPRDLLRGLSRALARDSRPVQPSPQVQAKPTRHSALDLPDVEDGPDPAAPRLSMALGDMYDDDDESYHSAPPRQSLLPDLPDDVDGGTVQSLEFGRRAVSEDPRHMFGGRYSAHFGDLSELGAVDEEFEIDGTFINQRRNTILDQPIDEALEEDDTTTQLRALTGRRDGRPSDVDLGIFGRDDDDTEEPTFRFNIPERIRAPARTREQEEQEQEEVGQDADSEPPGPQDESMQYLEDDEQNEATMALNGDDPTEPGGMLGWESEDAAEDDAALAAYREEASAVDRSLETQSPERPVAAKQGVRAPKEMRISKRGLDYPSFPTANVKKLAASFMKSQGSKARLAPDAIAELVKNTDDFFEQISIDLSAYAQHGGRKIIEESDVIALMKRYFTPFIVQTCTSICIPAH